MEKCLKIVMDNLYKYFFHDIRNSMYTLPQNCRLPLINMDFWLIQFGSELQLMEFSCSQTNLGKYLVSDLYVCLSISLAHISYSSEFVHTSKKCSFDMDFWSLKIIFNKSRSLRTVFLMKSLYFSNF